MRSPSPDFQKIHPSMPVKNPIDAQFFKKYYNSTRTTIATFSVQSSEANTSSRKRWAHAQFLSWFLGGGGRSMVVLRQAELLISEFWVRSQFWSWSWGPDRWWLSAGRGTNQFWPVYCHLACLPTLAREPCLDFAIIIIMIIILSILIWAIEEYSAICQQSMDW